MDADLSRVFEEFAVSTHETMAARGAVLPPTIFAVRRSAFVAMATVRPMVCGRDAFAAIALLGTLPSLGGCDEAAVVWETLDLARACRQPLPDNQNVVNLLTISGDDLRLVKLTNNVILDQNSGAISVEWTGRSVHHNLDLPAAILLLVEQCRPCAAGRSEALDDVAALLRNEGYDVSVVA